MDGTIKNVIFDFDGTIANTLEAGIIIINSLADEYGYKKVSKEDYMRLRDMQPRAILKEVGISWWKLPVIAARVRAALSSQMASVKAYPGMPEALVALKKQGKNLGILTTGSKENVLKFLQNNPSLNLFDFLHAESNLFGKGRTLKRLFGTYHLEPKETIYIGDEVRDVEAAKKAGVKAGAVTWGVNSKLALETAQPDFIVDEPGRLVAFIK
jgi:phosphoglycolate phosphatase